MMQEKQKNNRNNPERRKTPLWIILIIFCSAMLISTVMSCYHSAEKMTYDEISYTEFTELLNAGEIDSVQIGSSRIYGETKGKEGFMTLRVEDEDLTPRLIEAGVDVSRSNADNNTNMTIQVVMLLFYVLMLICLFRGLSRGMRKKPDWLIKDASSVKFSDVAGQEEAKESLMEMVDFLKNTGKYAEAGAKLPKGALLVGPPGTGKTLLAKAVAGEANVPFFSLSGSDFVELYVGMGASRVRSLFKDAKKNAPCIIFIDEIDAVAKKRGLSGSQEQEQTLNQLLAEMDGFGTDTGVVVLGATNRPENLDPAFTRPGRLDRIIEVSLPDLVEREEILKVHMRDVKADDTVDLHELALKTAGVSGADLASMVNEAAIAAVRKGRIKISQDDLEESIETVLVGKEKQSRTLNEKEKHIVSIHETGHALAAALKTHKQPVQKISIIPRTRGALGFVMQAPEEETYLQTYDELFSQLTVTLAGRAAEEIVFGKENITTGASDDLQKATETARAMVARFGLCGSLSCLEEQKSQYLGGDFVRTCSEEKSAWVDATVDELLNKAYEDAIGLLTDNRDVLENIAEYLCENETITGEKFMELVKEYRFVS